MKVVQITGVGGALVALTDTGELFSLADGKWNRVKRIPGEDASPVTVIELQDRVAALENSNRSLRENLERAKSKAGPTLAAADEAAEAARRAAIEQEIDDNAAERARTYGR